MNIKLLREIQHQIAIDADGFDMANWEKSDEIAVCGTTRCIGGYAICLHEGLPYISHYENEFMVHCARKALGLDISQAERLFLVSGWPLEFKARYCYYARAASRKQVAEVAIEYIDYFIQKERNQVVRPLN